MPSERKIEWSIGRTRISEPQHCPLAKQGGCPFYHRRLFWAQLRRGIQEDRRGNIEYRASPTSLSEPQNCTLAKFRTQLRGWPGDVGKRIALEH